MKTVRGGPARARGILAGPSVLRALGAVALALRLSAAGEPGPGAVEAVESVGMVVSDLERSVRFFREVLDFEEVSVEEVAGPERERLEGIFGLRMRVARLRLGEELLDLTQYLAPRGRPVPADSRSHDRWFQHVAIIVRDMDRAYARLRWHRVEHASPEPQRLPDWNRSAGGIRAFYFKDPDGHPLEVLQFPPDKGDPRWHRPGERLFLGIDHTAIVVQDTEASLRFYRDHLGFRVAGESENHGPEQERLNNVFGARLRITALRAPAGPGIELLQYLAPRDGRPAPADTRSNDLVSWQTRLVARPPLGAAERLLLGKFDFVSPGTVEIPAAGSREVRAFILRDPDGHALKVIEEVAETGKDATASKD